MPKTIQEWIEYAEDIEQKCVYGSEDVYDKPLWEESEVQDLKNKIERLKEGIRELNRLGGWSFKPEGDD